MVKNSFLAEVHLKFFWNIYCFVSKEKLATDFLLGKFLNNLANFGFYVIMGIV